MDRKTDRILSYEMAKKDAVCYMYMVAASGDFMLLSGLFFTGFATSNWHSEIK